MRSVGELTRWSSLGQDFDLVGDVSVVSVEELVEDRESMVGPPACMTVLGLLQAVQLADDRHGEEHSYGAGVLHEGGGIDVLELRVVDVETGLRCQDRDLVLVQ
ncbi:hypothetical protein [Streptomyces sp. NPDC002346]